MRTSRLSAAVTVIGLAAGLSGTTNAPAAPAADSHIEGRAAAGLTGSASASGSFVAQAKAPAATAADTRPNIVFITTDDQRVDDMRWMPFTRRLIGGHGINFTRAVSPHPLCCPARAEFVTGQYGQNNGVVHNAGPHGGFGALINPGNTLAKWLRESGYQTAMVGKYLNGYESSARRDPAWTHWNPSIGNVYSYRRTVFFDDGRHVDRSGEHVDDVVAKYAQRYITEFSKKAAPFYVWASDLAPHNATAGHPIPAPRHKGTLAKAVNPAIAKPSFLKNIVDGWQGDHDRSDRADIAGRFEARSETLRAVDEGVQRIVATLKGTGELNNTYIIFTSDNGYAMGEHGLVGKNFIYNEVVRVPLLVRTPTAVGPTVSTARVTIVDIAPTVAALAKVTPQRVVDGMSFAPLLRGQAMTWRDTQLVQIGRLARDAADSGWRLRGVRTSRWTYGKTLSSGAIELYDRVRDPFELVNLAYHPEYLDVVNELQRRTDVLSVCAGDSCRQNFGPVPEPVMP